MLQQIETTYDDAASIKGAPRSSSSLLLAAQTRMKPSTFFVCLLLSVLALSFELSHSTGHHGTQDASILFNPAQVSIRVLPKQPSSVIPESFSSTNPEPINSVFFGPPEADAMEDMVEDMMDGVCYPIDTPSQPLDIVVGMIQSYLMEVYTHRVHQVTSLWEGAWLHFYPGTIQWAQSSPASTPNHVNYTVTEITEEATITRVLESSIPSILPLADVVVVDSEYFTVVDSVMPGTTSISPLADEVCLASNATTTTFTPREEPSSPTSEFVIRLLDFAGRVNRMPVDSVFVITLFTITTSVLFTMYIACLCSIDHMSYIVVLSKEAQEGKRMCQELKKQKSYTLNVEVQIASLLEERATNCAYVERLLDVTSQYDDRIQQLESDLRDTQTIAKDQIEFLQYQLHLSQAANKHRVRELESKHLLSQTTYQRRIEDLGFQLVACQSRIGDLDSQLQQSQATSQQRVMEVEAQLKASRASSQQHIQDLEAQLEANKEASHQRISSLELVIARKDAQAKEDAAVASNQIGDLKAELLRSAEYISVLTTRLEAHEQDTSSSNACTSPVETDDSTSACDDSTVDSSADMMTDEEKEAPNQEVTTPLSPCASPPTMSPDVKQEKRDAVDEFDGYGNSDLKELLLASGHTAVRGARCKLVQKLRELKIAPQKKNGDTQATEPKEKGTRPCCSPHVPATTASKQVTPPQKKKEESNPPRKPAPLLYHPPPLLSRKISYAQTCALRLY